jgi:hypothetical protein
VSTTRFEVSVPLVISVSYADYALDYGYDAALDRQTIREDAAEHLRENILVVVQEYIDRLCGGTVEVSK